MLENNNVARMLGQQNTMIENNLMRARFATNLANDDLRLRADGLSNQAYNDVVSTLLIVRCHDKKYLRQGPSTLGLVANMGGDA